MLQWLIDLFTHQPGKHGLRRVSHINEKTNKINGKKASALTSASGNSWIIDKVILIKDSVFIG